MTRDELLDSVAGHSLNASPDILTNPLKTQERQELERAMEEFLGKGGAIQEVESGVSAQPAGIDFPSRIYMGVKLAAAVRAEREARQKGQQP